MSHFDLSRRNALQIGGLGLLGLTTPKLLRAAEQRIVHPAPRAKSVLFVFLWGSPSHLDTCDPKPDAPMEYRGPFAVIPTRTPGVHFTELLPQTARRSDRFTLIRSHVTTAPGHPDGGTVALTGFEEAPGPVQPNFGSIIAKHHTQQSGSLPPFFSIANGTLADAGRRIEGYGGGTLGGRYDPFMVGTSEAGEVSDDAAAPVHDGAEHVEEESVNLRRDWHGGSFRDWALGNRYWVPGFGLLASGFWGHGTFVLRPKV